jgi:hypothetical protein
MRKYLFTIFAAIPFFASAQLQWENVDSLYGPLPESVHVFRTGSPLDGKPNIAYYLIASLKDRKLEFTADTTRGRRLTPSQFYSKNGQPLVVANCTFFSFETNGNLNTVIKNGKLVSHNRPALEGRGKDTMLYIHHLRGAIGIDKKRRADVAWTYTDSSRKHAYAAQKVFRGVKDSTRRHSFDRMEGLAAHSSAPLKKWKMRTAVGGGPVLLQDGNIRITNDEERMFGGKAINDKHPRTAMGYTADGKLVILVVQGRFPGQAEGATLVQLAQIFKDLGCVEALNLDGGGSSCLLVNGKETIKPSDKEGQRAVPAVFIINR